MVNYQNGKVYKLVCNTTGLVYYGSTCEPTLARRLHQHKNSYICEKVKVKCTSTKVLENDNYGIFLVENYPCDNKDELRMRERFYIENNVCVNKCIPIRFKEEKPLLYKGHYERNKTERLENMKIYYMEHKQEIDEYQNAYREANKEKFRGYGNTYREANKEKLREVTKRSNYKRYVKTFFLNYLKCFNV